MQFKVEQVALCPIDADRAIKLLAEMGMTEWVEDFVYAEGSVGSTRDASNLAHLSFNYQGLEGARELEVLDYRHGDNWMEGKRGRISHLGMHCSAEELEGWREFFTKRHIGVAQEVDTKAHGNPAIAGQRWYHYCIFDTRPILGVDIKFIVRKDSPE